jgi:hypothetical protein
MDFMKLTLISVFNERTRLTSPANTPLVALRSTHARWLFICSSAIVLFLRKRDPLCSRPNTEAIASTSNRSFSVPAPKR